MGRSTVEVEFGGRICKHLIELEMCEPASQPARSQNGRDDENEMKRRFIIRSPATFIQYARGFAYHEVAGHHLAGPPAAVKIGVYRQYTEDARVKLKLE